MNLLEALSGAWEREPVGLIGAILAVLSLVWNVIQWRIGESTRLKIITQLGMLTPPLKADVLMAEVMNRSQHGAQVLSFGIAIEARGPLWRLWPRRTRPHFTLIASQLARSAGLAPPKTIPPKQSGGLAHELHYMARDVLNASDSSKIRLRAWVRAGESWTPDLGQFP
ncbi:MAG: hypothetical protein U5K81_10590 [Trueperaceae bacterium]|nr:hypothetical protein [Trueperaceae bacterium]